MTMEEFIDYQEKAFLTYFLTLIKNEARDAQEELDREAERKTNLSALSVPLDMLPGLSAEDVYEGLETIRTFFVRDMAVPVRDPLLGEAISSLPPKRREVILLFYFLDKSDPQIGALLHLDPKTINLRRRSALARLRDELEARKHEPK